MTIFCLYSLGDLIIAQFTDHEQYNILKDVNAKEWIKKNIGSSRQKFFDNRLLYITLSMKAPLAFVLHCKYVYWWTEIITAGGCGEPFSSLYWVLQT